MEGLLYIAGFFLGFILLATIVGVVFYGYVLFVLFRYLFTYIKELNAKP